MTVKEYLEQATRLDERILFEKQECQRLREMAQGLRSPSLQGRVDGSQSNEANFVKELEKLDREERYLQEDIKKMVALRIQINQVIRQVRDPELIIILRQHYLCGKSLETIALQLHCGRTSVFRREEKAMRKIVLPKDAVDLNQSLQESDIVSLEETG